MFARCPACHTVFRVRSEQLRAHHGQVRCGSCYAPFDALDNLIEELGPTESTSPGGESPTAPAMPRIGKAEPVFVLEEKQEPVFSDELDFELPDALLPQRKPSPEVPDERIEPDERPASPSPFSLDSLVDAGEERLGETAQAAARPPAAEPTSPQEIDVADEAPAPPAEPAVWRRGGRARPEAAEPPLKITEPPPSPASVEPERPPPPAEATPAPVPHQARSSLPFVHEEYVTDSPEDEDRYTPQPRRNLRKGLQGLGLGLLAGVLVAQTIYLFRAEIAREWPLLRPPLVRACIALGCTVELPRIAGAISVESSDLQSEPGKPGRFVLSATIRNRAPHPQAYPHLELTLTDAQDRPLVRRVLAPLEWAPGADLEKGFGAGRDLNLTLPFSATGVGATGYRIYAFYP